MSTIIRHHRPYVEGNTQKFLVVIDTGEYSIERSELRHIIELQTDIPVDERSTISEAKHIERELRRKLLPYIDATESILAWTLDEGEKPIFLLNELTWKAKKKSRKYIKERSRILRMCISETQIEHPTLFLERLEVEGDVFIDESEPYIPDDEELHEMELEEATDALGGSELISVVHSDYWDFETDWRVIGTGYRLLNLTLPFKVSDKMGVRDLENTNRAVGYALSECCAEIVESETCVVEDMKPTLNLYLLKAEWAGMIIRRRRLIEQETALVNMS